MSKYTTPRWTRNPDAEPDLTFKAGNWVSYEVGDYKGQGTVVKVERDQVFDCDVAMVRCDPQAPRADYDFTANCHVIRVMASDIKSVKAN